MNTPGIHDLLDHFRREYERITPAAAGIQRLLAGRGEPYVNDHIAIRTFDRPPIGVASLGATFLERGYRESGAYVFERKRLRARSYAPPTADLPHVFISELLTDAFSPRVRAVVEALVGQIPQEMEGSPALYMRAPSWLPVSYAEYTSLLEESEYAAWVAAFGIRVNHFTVSLNALQTFDSIHAFNAWLVEHGYTLNASGGEVKGSPDALLEQSSIMAGRTAWEFAGGEQRVIPTCYHEFARRYVDPATGRPYEGFIARSADRIFESTNARVAA